MKKIGWIGTGIMGKNMASHLIKKGHELFVFNRTASKADALVKMGAKYMDNPRQVAEKADYMFLMLGHPHDV
jgi:3-hydroxyisobutyrate dehydrogenase